MVCGRSAACFPTCSSALANSRLLLLINAEDAFFELRDPDVGESPSDLLSHAQECNELKVSNELKLLVGVPSPGGRLARDAELSQGAKAPADSSREFTPAAGGER